MQGSQSQQSSQAADIDRGSLQRAGNGAYLTNANATNGRRMYATDGLGRVCSEFEFPAKRHPAAAAFPPRGERSGEMVGVAAAGQRDQQNEPQDFRGHCCDPPRPPLRRPLVPQRPLPRQRPPQHHERRHCGPDPGRRGGGGVDRGHRAAAAAGGGVGEPRERARAGGGRGAGLRRRLTLAATWSGSSALGARSSAAAGLQPGWQPVARRKLLSGQLQASAIGRKPGNRPGWQPMMTWLAADDDLAGSR
mmetsp:Transcript_40415/g.108478  ORF Transcript_40415/g.108478 Transcript_40415/m.108478 type:complete len:249 (-) Transcript_40415:47-793(-)